jgi:hypothetical protein
VRHTRVLQVAAAIGCVAVAVLYLAWLTIAAWATGHHHLVRGDIMRWGTAVLLPAAALVLVSGAGAVWWAQRSTGAATPSILRLFWTRAALVFVAAYSIFCGLEQGTASVGSAVGSAAITVPGMLALFLLPMLCSPRLRQRTDPRA